MTDLTDTRTRVLERAAARNDGLAMPLPKHLHGAAAKKAVARMIDLGLLEEVGVNITRSEPLWRETGECYDTTLIAAEAILAAIRMLPAQIRTRLNRRAPEPIAFIPSAPRTGTKLALLIEMHSARDGDTITEISEETGWPAHTVRGAISGTLRKKFGLTVISERTADHARVCKLQSG